LVATAVVAGCAHWLLGFDWRSALGAVLAPTDAAAVFSALRRAALPSSGLYPIAVLGLFVMLGLLASPSRLPAQILPALLTGAVAVFLARPAAVAVSMLPLRLGRLRRPQFRAAGNPVRAPRLRLGVIVPASPTRFLCGFPCS
jgi:NhaP-type Na+/H+ and K+/H+ antiporter